MQTKLLRPLHEHYAAMAGAADVGGFGGGGGGGGRPSHERAKACTSIGRQLKNLGYNLFNFPDLHFRTVPTSPSFPVRSCT